MWTLIPVNYRGYDIWAFADYVEAMRRWAKHYPRYELPTYSN